MQILNTPQPHSELPETFLSEELQLENLRLRARVQELEQLVICDTLTPLYNRRHFMDELDRWCWRTHRYGGQHGLLYIDVDNMKTINDRYGHAIGDAVLIAIAKALQNNVRRSDLAARIGGDEFALLLDNIEANELPIKAKKLEESMANVHVRSGDIHITPAISVGISAIEAGARSAALLERADASMYVAKQLKRG